MQLNHRLHDRIRYKTWIKLVPVRGESLLSHIEDISSDGLGVEHERPLVVDSECHLYFMLPLAGKEHIIQARCRVASCLPVEATGRYHIGLAFESFVSDPRETATLIENFIQHNLQQSE
ncbi:PilZ domain-containing protein [Chitinimonas sp. PSY-7]|uniref:PilZ domain-containing protein n=1 Tax=Chitinimonas sp. PSY-7 TaxID=3459088 RepID=UPI00404012C2